MSSKRVRLLDTQRFRCRQSQQGGVTRTHIEAVGPTVEQGAALLRFGTRSTSDSNDPSAMLPLVGGPQRTWFGISRAQRDHVVWDILRLAAIRVFPIGIIIGEVVFLDDHDMNWGPPRMLRLGEPSADADGDVQQAAAERGERHEADHTSHVQLLLRHAP